MVFGSFYLSFINNTGSSVKLANKASNIANAVNRPKKMVGMKLENAKIENPRMMITEVK